MVILRMIASFGRLKGEELRLDSGLNILALPNEAGKSTWSAFLLAMFYGIDTSERKKGGSIPAKLRYQPWEGGNMEGRIDLLHEGRALTIERTGPVRAPMSVFRCYDTNTGEAVPEITGETCGQMLLGVSRAVFERSAFVRQAGLCVGPDADLESRLTALSSSGEEGVSATEAAQALREEKNRVRHNKTGLLPRAEEALASVTERLNAIHAAHIADLELRQREQALLEEQQELQTAKRALDAIAQRERLRKKQQAENDLQDANDALTAARQAASELPDAQTLEGLERELRALAARTPPEPPEPLPEKPAVPKPFADCPEDGILEKARRDGLEFDRLTADRHQPAVLWLVLGILMLLAAALLGWRRMWAPMGAAAVLLLLCAALFILFHRQNLRREKKLSQAEELLGLYENRNRDEFTAYAAEYREQLLQYRYLCDRHAQVEAAMAAFTQSGQAQLTQILDTVAVFAPGVTELRGARQAVSAALCRWDAVTQAENRTQTAQARFEAVCLAVGEVRPAAVPPGDWSGYDAQSVERSLLRTERELSEVRGALARSRGRVEGFGDSAALAAEKERLENRIAALRQRYDALCMAETALEIAASRMQERFAPQLSQEAGSIFAALTKDRYERVLMNRSMELQAGQAGQTVTYPTPYLSGGTMDALYFSLRLAICRQALDADTPIVLDDALVMFDDARMIEALRLLRQEAEHRQILLFTCQTREQKALAEL